MSSTFTRVIGIDPGPTPGFVGLDIEVPKGEQHGYLVGPPLIVQCSASFAAVALEGLLTVVDYDRVLVQIEAFVQGNRTRSARGAGKTTGNMVRDLRGVWLTFDIEGQWVERSAAAVKPWATDARLDAAGLTEATKGMVHARDAARHAAFRACHAGLLPDPLSTAGRKAWKGNR